MIALFGSENLLGDSLGITQAIAAYKRKNPAHRIVLVTPKTWISDIFLNNPFIDEIIYHEGGFLQNRFPHMYQTIPGPNGINEVPGFRHYFSCNVAYTFANEQLPGGCSISEAYAHQIGVKGMSGNAHEIYLTPEEMAKGKEFQKMYGAYIAISPYSISNEPREGKNDPALYNAEKNEWLNIHYRKTTAGNKAWAASNWQKLFDRMTTNYPQYRKVILGAADDHQLWKGVKYALGLPVREVAGLLMYAHRLITLDNGIAHLGVAVRVPILEIYPKCLPLKWVVPESKVWVHQAEPADLTVDEFWSTIQQFKII